MQQTSFKSNLATLLVTLIVLYLGAEAFSYFYLSRTEATNKELTIYQPSETRGWELKPESKAIHGPAKPPPEIFINALGFRDSETTVNKPKNVTRVLLLGDSFTFGMITDQKKIFPYLLEQKLNYEIGRLKKRKYEVLNFGIIGYAIDQYYLLLREKGLSYKPDIVIIMFFAGNDATELRNHEWVTDENGDLKAVKDSYHFVTEDSQLRRKIASRMFKTPFFTLAKERGKLLLSKLRLPVESPRLLWSNFLPQNHKWGDPKINEYFEKTKELLELIKKMNDENKIKTLIAIVPADIQVNLKYLKKYPGAPFSEKYFDDPETGLRPQTILKEFGEREGIEILDLLPEFRQVTGDLYYTKDDPHFTAAGHKAASDMLFQRLVELKYVL